MKRAIFLILFIVPLFIFFYPIKEYRIKKTIKEEKNLTRFQIEDNNKKITEAIYYFDNQSQKKRFEMGDKVILEKHLDSKGKNIYFIADFDRRKHLLFLFFIFLLLVYFIVGKKSLRAFFTLIFTFFILFFSIIPNIINGANPYISTIMGGMIIIPISYFISHGFNKKSLSAILGSLIALFLTIFLATIYVSLSKITGVSEETNFLKVITQKDYNYQGIYFASIVIGLLGVLDDVSINQASIVEKLADQKISFLEIYQKAISVGQDHINSIINTLILVYASASLPLLLLFDVYNKNFLEVLNYEIISQEIIRTLLATIGIVLAIPLTTLIAVRLFKEK